MYRYSIILLVCLVAMLAGCQQMPVVLSIQAETSDPAVHAVVDGVSQEHYQRYHLAVENMGLGLYGGADYDMGHRNRNFRTKNDPTLGNQEACLYLKDKFTEMGLTVSVQGSYKNVIGELTGTTTPEKIYIIGAHYDHLSGDRPGGDDNASGTAGVLEAARVMSQYQFESTIRFIGFNAEEHSWKGSRDYVNNHVIPGGENIVGMINMDMILRPGSDTMPDRPIDVELETNGSLGWAKAYAQAMADYVPSLVMGDLWNYIDSESDNDSFQKAGIPALLVIENSYGDWYSPDPIANSYYHAFGDASDRGANDPDSASGVTYDYAFATDIVRIGVAFLAQEAKLVPQPDPVVLSIQAGTADPAVLGVVDGVSQEQYQRYQLAVESMGLGLYGGEEYNLGYRNRDISGTYSTLGNQEAGLYLKDKFKEMGLTVSVQGKYKNVIGELTGTVTPEKIYIIGAHYDHIKGDMPGGDDNASGTAGMLEAARVLSRYKFESTIRFIGFNAEEDGLRGSKDYVENHVIPIGENIAGMINMDAILRPGSDTKPDRPIDVEIETNGSLGWVKAYVQAMADYVPSLVMGDIWDYAESYSDNDSFQDKGIPSFLVIENSDGDWYAPNPIANTYIHHREDASDRLANNPNSPTGVTYDYAFATDITRTTVALIAQEAKLMEEPRIAQFDKIHEVIIPMPDGVNLAADLYMPDGMNTGERLPVLLEYLPYRKDEARGARYPIYSYFIERGFVVARVDIRGTGNSQGRTIPYEYSEIELDDGEVVIGWLGKQDWSNGNVGMFGISWSGFNSIQMAMRHPPALKAFIAMMATEELYQEDVHYMDGIMHTDLWMMSNDLYNSMPGAPEFRLDREWLRNRFELEPSVFTYMRHQRDGAFWDRASARGKYDKITVPGFHIGGWYDAYRDSLPRMLENVKAPVKAMIGPWEHCFPHNAWPKPQMEWRHEAVRWFDHWLKGVDTGIMDEPRFAVYVRNWHGPGTEVVTVPGKWRWEEGWPIERCKWQTLYAGDDHGLSSSPAEKATHSMAYKPSMGLEGGGPIVWWGSLIPDQQGMDDDCLVYDSEPLKSELEILGMPRAILNVSADASRANWVVRISDVAPDGSVTQVGGAGFNGTHRKSAREPEDLIPGEVFPLEIEMHFTSWVFPKGHRIRFAVSNAQWPMFWPTPYPMTTTLAIGGPDGGRIVLPVIPPSDRPGPKFKPPAANPVMPGYGTVDSGNLSGYAEIVNIERNEATGDALAFATNTTTNRYPWGLERLEERIEHRTSDIDPARTSVTGIYALVVKLKDRTIRLEQDVVFKSDPKNFQMTFIRRLKVNGKIMHEKQWDETFPRDFQ